MNTSRKLFIAAGSSAALAYAHGFASAYLETEGMKHYAHWASGAAYWMMGAALTTLIVGLMFADARK